MLAKKIDKLFPGIDFEKDCLLQDDGKGPYIRKWNRAEPEPTQTELDAVSVLSDAEVIAQSKSRESLKLKSLKTLNASIVAAFPDIPQRKVVQSILKLYT